MANNIGVTKYLSTPIIGLLPFILYFILHILDVREEFALVLSLAFSLIGEICIRRFFKSRIFSLTFYVSSISLAITFVFFFFVHDYLQTSTVYPIFCEISVVCIFMVIKVSQTYISAIYLRKKTPLLKAYFNEFYHTIAILQYVLTIQLFLVLIYSQFIFFEENFGFFEQFTVLYLPILIILSVGIYQFVRVHSISTRLRFEEWLPIVSETGDVTGKVSKQVSLNMKNRFLHPVVRVALICNGKIFLQERPQNDILDPGKLDYPFEKYLLYNHEINLAARNSIRLMIGETIADIPIRFILKYTFDNENTRRLVFLYSIDIQNEEQIRRTTKMTGKFWSIKQIEEVFGDEVFSENFELEFEYMKNMVLLPPSNKLSGGENPL